MYSKYAMEDLQNYTKVYNILDIKIFFSGMNKKKLEKITCFFKKLLYKYKNKTIKK